MRKSINERLTFAPAFSSIVCKAIMSERIIYMGTADFAVKPLCYLADAGLNIVAVVTMPDKPMGRGHKVKCSAVKEYALKHRIEVLQPEKLSDPSFVARLRELQPDLGIVVAFRMLPQEVWSLPRLGTINLHGSLLPQYRGVAPINHAIINGESTTGVSTFLLRHEIDTGDILDQEETIIGPNETAGELHNKLATLGADLLLRTVKSYLNGSSCARKQDEMLSTCQLKPAPKIFKADCEIDWHKTAQEIHNFVRGLNPVPSAWSTLGIETKSPEVYKIHAINPFVEEPIGIPSKLRIGQCYVHQGKQLWVVCGDRMARITKLQAPGKRPMSDQDLLNGLR